MVETAAAAVVLPVFVYYAYSIPHTMSKIASILIVLWAIFVVVRLRWARKHQPGNYTLTYLEYLQESKIYLLDQKRLLDTVIYWYILPCMCFALLFLAGFLPRSGDPTKVILKAMFCLLLGLLVFYLNRRAVTTQIKPRLKKVDELIKVMNT